MEATFGCLRTLTKTGQERMRKTDEKTNHPAGSSSQKNVHLTILFITAKCISDLNAYNMRLMRYEEATTKNTAYWNKSKTVFSDMEGCSQKITVGRSASHAASSFKS